jgi:hypothetical protein
MVGSRRAVRRRSPLRTRRRHKRRLILGAVVDFVRSTTRLQILAAALVLIAVCGGRFAYAQDAQTASLTPRDACLRGSILSCAALPPAPRSGGAAPDVAHRAQLATTSPGAAATASGPQPDDVGAITGLPLDRHDRLTHYLAWQVGGAGLDLWSTGYCLDRNPRCHEGNPLGATVDQRVALKFIHIAAFAGGANVLERGGHRTWARVINAIGFGVQAFAFAHNISNAHKGPK